MGSLLAMRCRQTILPTVSGRGNSIQRAFSILESLVVILVILLLTSIVIPGILGRVREEPTLPQPNPEIQGKGSDRPGNGEDPEPGPPPEPPPTSSAESVVEK